MANVHISVREPASVLNPLAVDRYDIPSMFCVHSVKEQQRIVAIKASPSTDVETDRLLFEKLHLSTSLVHVVSAISSYNFMLADGRYLGLRDGKIFEVRE